MSSKLVFLTGASGFIGLALLKKLLARGSRVRVLTAEASDGLPSVIFR